MTAPTRTEPTAEQTLEEQKRAAAKAARANDTKSAPMGASPRPVSAGGEVVVEMTTITPEMAENWLETANTSNRNLRNRFVDLLTGAIQRGEWQVNGDAIKFDFNGKLLDGQHRLWAIVLADQPVETLVITGLPPETQDTMDMGVRRKLADVLAIRLNNTDAVALGAALNLLYRLKEGQVRAGRGTVPTVAQALKLYEDNLDILDGVKAAHKVRRGGVKIPPAVLSVAHWQFTHIEDDDPEQLAKDVEYFFDRLADGVQLAPKSPILALRRVAESHSHGRERPSSTWFHAVVIKAWNAFRLGKPVEMIGFKSGGSRPEAWPNPV